MKITKPSPVTGQLRTREINVTQEQLDRWRGGELIQRVMPHLTPEEREFLISGSSSEEWDEMWKEE